MAKKTTPKVKKVKVQNKKQGEFAVNTIIGPGSHVQGDIEASGFTRIDGNVKGNIHAQGRVIVGENARMRSSITGTSITIGGVVDGNILASERLLILPSALIIGDITTRRMDAMEGCLIHGRVCVCRNDDSWNRAKSRYRDKRNSLSAGYSPYAPRS